MYLNILSFTRPYVSNLMLSYHIFKKLYQEIFDDKSNKLMQLYEMIMIRTTKYSIRFRVSFHLDCFCTDRFRK